AGRRRADRAGPGRGLASRQPGPGAKPSTGPGLRRGTQTRQCRVWRDRQVRWTRYILTAGLRDIVSPEREGHVPRWVIDAPKLLEFDGAAALRVRVVSRCWLRLGRRAWTWRACPASRCWSATRPAS